MPTPNSQATPKDDKQIIDEKEIAEFKRISFPLKSVNAGEENADLAPVKEMIGNATVVALGEGTHGTAEFFKMKHRLLEYLVTEMGFTVFAIEANMPECQLINEYVQSGKGNLKDLIEKMQCVPWYTQEVFDMVEWMRCYNLTAKVKLQFAGFDMQYPERSEEILERNLLQADSKFDNKNFHTIIAEIKRTKAVICNPASPKKDKSEAHKKLLENIDLLLAEIKKHQKYLENKLGVVEYQWTLQNAILLEQWAKKLVDFRYRDKAMADNVLWIQKQNPDAKIVLWAHNGHVYKQKCEGPPFDPMGHYLAVNLKDNYRVIGFATYEGNYTAVLNKKLYRDLVLSVPPNDSLESCLKKIGHPISLINLHTANAAGSKCLKGKMKLRYVGWIELEGHKNTFASHSLPQSYDGIVYIETTTASQPIMTVAKRVALINKNPSHAADESATWNWKHYVAIGAASALAVWGIYRIFSGNAGNNTAAAPSMAPQLKK